MVKNQTNTPGLQDKRSVLVMLPHLKKKFMLLKKVLEMAVKFLFLLKITIDTTLKNVLITVKPMIKCSRADWRKPELTSVSLPEAVVSDRGSFQSLVTSAEGTQVPLGWTPGAPQHTLKPSGLGLAALRVWCPETEPSGGARGEASSRVAPRGSRSVRHRPFWTCGRGCAGAQGTGRLGPVGTPPWRTPPLMPVLIILTTDTSSASEDEGSLRRPGRLASAPLQSHPSVEPWLEQVTQGSSTSSSASSTSSHPGGQPAAAPSTATAPAGPAALARVGQCSRRDPSRQGSPCAHPDPPSPFPTENVLLVTEVVPDASVVWQPQTLWRVGLPRGPR